MVNTNGKELTIDEAADFVGLSKDSIRNHARDGLIGRKKEVRRCSVQDNIRRRFLYKKTDLEKLKG